MQIPRSAGTHATPIILKSSRPTSGQTELSKPYLASSVPNCKAPYTQIYRKKGITIDSPSTLLGDTTNKTSVCIITNSAFRHQVYENSRLYPAAWTCCRRQTAPVTMLRHCSDLTHMGSHPTLISSIESKIADAWKSRRVRLFWSAFHWLCHASL